MTTDQVSQAQDVQYIGFWARAFASFVDLILLSIFMSPFEWYLFGGHDRSGSFSDPAHFLISIIVPEMVVIMFWARVQATPGKFIIHARIVDEKTYGEPTVNQLIIRYVGCWISLIACGIGYFWIAWDPKKQAWHDKMAHTLVIRHHEPAAGPSGVPH
jgi:uncharacterized RDD family membrane protein YckC